MLVAQRYVSAGNFTFSAKGFSSNDSVVSSTIHNDNSQCW